MNILRLMHPIKKIIFVIVVFIILSILVLLSGCLKTSEKLITHFEVCEQFKKDADTEDYRDPYDNCLMVKEDYIKSTEGCLATCKEYCEKQDLKYNNMWIDFSGCHCYCKKKLK
ncbi:MAG: hypothetical protein QXK37_06235 [Candidatus Woesearchaeota archaeon]